MNRFDNQTVLVTGGSSGIGLRPPRPTPARAPAS
ncbi:hypothetical protein X551_04482 [Methylibium sp. T29]|nr:hypothetical protein X551_04482 [Methylibium sp. T29]